MTRAQRRRFMVAANISAMIHQLRPLQFERRTMQSFDRIETRLHRLDPAPDDISPSDARAILAARDKIGHALRQTEDDQIDALAWLYSSAAILADEAHHCRVRGAVAAAAEYETLEGMVATAARHIDPESCDYGAMVAGERMAQTIRLAIV